VAGGRSIKLTLEQMRRFFETEEDFIALRRFGFSLKKLEARYPDGAPLHVVARAMALTKEEAASRYNEIVLKLRDYLGEKT